MPPLRRRLHLRLVRPVWRSSRRLAPAPRRFLLLWAIVLRGFLERYVPALRSDRRRTVVVQGRAGERRITLRANAWDTFTFYEVLLEQVYRSALALRPGATVLDVGANIGVASTYFLLHEPTARVVAVEPEPGNFALLQENLADSGARLHRAAITAGGGEATLTVREATRHRIDGAGGPGADRLVVPALTLDDLLPDGERADVSKVDIEGAEGPSFARAWRALERVDRSRRGSTTRRDGRDQPHARRRWLPPPSTPAVELPETYVR